MLELSIFTTQLRGVETHKKTNLVSSCLSFFLSASTSATCVFTAPSSTTTIISGTLFNDCPLNLGTLYLENLTQVRGFCLSRVSIFKFVFFWIQLIFIHLVFLIQVRTGDQGVQSGYH